MVVAREGPQALKTSVNARFWGSDMSRNASKTISGLPTCQGGVFGGFVAFGGNGEGFL